MAVTNTATTKISPTLPLTTGQDRLVKQLLAFTTAHLQTPGPAVFTSTETPARAKASFSRICSTSYRPKPGPQQLPPWQERPIISWSIIPNY